MKSALLTLSLVFICSLGYHPRWLPLILLALPLFFFAIQSRERERLRGSLVFFWLVVALELLPWLFSKPILLSQGFALPLGLSFLTFQAISFTVDWRRGKIATFPSLPDYLLFLFFFPKFLCGPLERFDHFRGEVARACWFPREKRACAGRLIVTGLAKKLLLANYLHPLTHLFFDQAGAPVSLLSTAAVTTVFALEFYCDFSAYTNLAEGMALLFGIELVPNFRQPYLAQNPQEFWQRWHISLSVWFRDYVHYPLFFLTKNISLTVFATFLLMGIWHGLGRNYLILGAYWGSVMVAFAHLQPWRLRAAEKWGKSWLYRACGSASTLLIVLISFFFLRANEAFAWEKLSWAEPWRWSVLLEQSLLRLLFCAPLFVVLERWGLKAFSRTQKIGLGLLLAYYAFILFFFTEERGLTDVRFLYFQF